MRASTDLYKLNNSAGSSNSSTSSSVANSSSSSLNVVQFREQTLNSNVYQPWTKNSSSSGSSDSATVFSNGNSIDLDFFSYLRLTFFRIGFKVFKIRSSVYFSGNEKFAKSVLPLVQVNFKKFALL